MRRSKRIIRHLNYAPFNSDGIKVYKDAAGDGPVDISQSKMDEQTEKLQTLQVQIATIDVDLEDFLDEYDVDEMEPHVEDFDKAIHRVEEFRSVLREKHRIVRLIMGDAAYADHYGDALDTSVNRMRKYLAGIREARKETRKGGKRAEESAHEANEKYFYFVRDEVFQKLADISAEVSQDPANLKDDNELLARKENIVEIQKRLDSIWDRILEMMKMNVDSGAVDATNAKHRELVDAKNQYAEDLLNELSIREIKKKENFKKSKLNIQLAKFSGYNSATDIYTFQSEFEKIYLADTPSNVLPELVRNNYLLDPALSLVKTVDNISDIWKRLKQAYGNPKILLQRKLRELTKADSSLQRSTDYQKVELWLSKIISSMKDLAKLVDDHEIEGMLYNGDAIDKVLRLLGDQRVSRWLAKDCYHDEYDNEEENDFEQTGKDSWASLVTFLEKELRIVQRKTVVFDKIPDKDNSNNKTPANKGFPVNCDGNAPCDGLGSAASTDGGHASTDGSNAATGGGAIGGDSLGTGAYSVQQTPATACFICGDTGHMLTPGPGNSKMVQYFSCGVWAAMTPEERYRFLREKGYCFQCVYPGADWNDAKHKEGKCQREFACKHPSHNRFKTKKHVLVCHEHSHTKENADLLKRYKDKCFPKNKIIPQFTRDIKIVFHCQTDVHASQVKKKKAIYLFQIIEIDNEQFLLFFDNGCSGFLVSYNAILRLGSNAERESPPPVEIGGLSGSIVVSPYGEFSVTLSLHDGTTAVFTGPCLDKITHTFPNYSIKGQVEDDIHRAYEDAGGDMADLPKLPPFIGGDVHMMMGVQYLRYHPEPVFQIPTSGLTIYKSKFIGLGGGRGIVGGPHELFDMMEKEFYQQGSHLSTFLSNQIRMYTSGYLVNPDVGMLGYKDPESLESLDVYENQPTVNLPSLHDPSSSTFGNGSSFPSVVKQFQLFEAVENVGSEISFRCIDCRDCPKCKEGEHTESISLKEEIEDDLINKSVTLNLEERRCTFKMPLIMDPLVHLAPNREVAAKIYRRQLKLLKTEEMKQDVIAAEDKLQKLGKVEYVHNLPEHIQEMLKNSPIQNFIPWRIVRKVTSISTPTRPVFDATFPTPSGKSLNDIVAKGKNNLNKLQEIFIRWLFHSVAFHTDIQTMYPSVHLREEDWCLQRYLWHPDLDPVKDAMEKVIMTCIYGVKSSGNVAQRAVRETAEASRSDYPEVYEVVRYDTYMDDCFSGEEVIQDIHQRADQMEIVLRRGGFALKGFTISGSPPLEKLTDDGESIYVGGMKWYPETDELAYNVKDLNFVTKRRGRRPVETSNKIPEQLTRRHITSNLAQIFDLPGRLTPALVNMKLDLHDLVVRKLAWDDVLPDNLRALWSDHFDMMQEIKNVRYKRAVVPVDAVRMEIDTLDFGDASGEMACVAIYARFLRQNGQYSCQLILARSRLVPENMTQPRAELYAALLNTHSGEVVRKALHKIHTGHMKFSDSQIALHWIKSEDRPLKQWVRNRTIEIRRWTNLYDWRYVDSKNMVADIGTRRGCTLGDIAPESTWIQGLPWMKEDASTFPVKELHELAPSVDDLKTAKSEMTVTEPIQERCLLTRYVDDKTEQRYKFSNYFLDPNKFEFSKVVRILAVVLKYIRSTKSNVNSDVVYPVKADPNLITINDDEIQLAENYYFTKATAEIKHFLKKKHMKNLTETDGILYYTGRLLPEEVNVVTPLSGTMKDLQKTSFCVPAIDKHSPLAYAVVNSVHWHHPDVKHLGVETTWRYVLMKAYIIEGRDLVNRIKHSCERCRFLYKRTVAVAMGPLPNTNLSIAPAFYVTQMDLAGPFKSYCMHNRRSTIKVWLLVYCCSTTSAIKVKVMEDYSTKAFIFAFIRFSSDVGYPRKLMIDEGSQLVKGVSTMKLDFVDIRSKLHKEVGVECEVCPVGGHNVNGRVERKIRQVKESLNRNMVNERLSILQWETMSAKIANSINNLPLALGNKVSNFESMDLITPNRLLLGRNNERSPSGDMLITTSPEKILEDNNRVFRAWFENWLVSCVPNLIYQPKWFDTDHHMKPGDIVLFIKGECNTPVYQYGIVDSIHLAEDGLTREAVVRYRNADEDTDRKTNRAVRSLVVIHKVDEVPIAKDLYEMSLSSKALYSNVRT